MLSGGTATLRPRDYQLEALKWALSKGKAVVVLPTGAGKTLIAALWANELLKSRKSAKVLVLEPTRILVEQVARYISGVIDARVVGVHGQHTRRFRERAFSEFEIVVTTPEMALSELKTIISQGFDALVIDECYHTTGKDAYMEFIKKVKFKWKLGLTAYLPPSRKGEITRHIGEIRVWSWTDPRISKYVPAWIGEVYEAELNEAEKRILQKLEQMRNSASGKLRALIQLAIRWFVRDGALALKESMKKDTVLGKILRENVKELLQNENVREAHKLEALLRVLNDHEGFNKAIVFVDRVVLTRYISRSLREYNAIAIHGRRHHQEHVRAILSKAKRRDVRVIVSTSAGEEGLDLPEADLLVIWSNVASPIRFIQRHGRIRRLAGEEGSPKFVAYLVTPDTPDTDSFIESIELAKKAGVDDPINEPIVEMLWKRTTVRRILNLLEESPLTVEWIQELTGIPEDLIRRYLRKLMSRGDVIYAYTPLGKVFVASIAAEILEEKFCEYFEPELDLNGVVRIVTATNKSRKVRGNYFEVREKLLSLIRKYGLLKSFIVTFEVPLEGGALKLVNLPYTFPIDDSRVLELILKNAFSVKKFTAFYLAILIDCGAYYFLGKSVKVGFIGLGLMGYGMACSIAKEGYELYVFNRTLSKAEKLVRECGGEIVGSPKEMVMKVDIIHIMVSDNEAVANVVFGGNGLINSLGKGKYVIVSSTITPQFSLVLKDAIEGRGGRYVEAPVLGSVSEAREGKLLTYVGGREADLEIGSLKAFSKKIYYVGEVPKAAALKLAMNNLFLSIVASLAESVGLAKAWGISEDDLFKYLSDTWMKVVYERYRKRGYDKEFPTRFPIRLAAKDLMYAAEALRYARLPHSVSSAAAEVFTEAITHGYIDNDYSHVMLFMKELAESLGFGSQ